MSRILTSEKIEVSMQRHKERERKTDMFLSLALALAVTKTNLIPKTPRSRSKTRLMRCLGAILRSRSRNNKPKLIVYTNLYS